MAVDVYNKGIIELELTVIDRLVIMRGTTNIDLDSCDEIVKIEKQIVDDIIKRLEIK